MLRARCPSSWRYATAILDEVSQVWIATFYGMGGAWWSCKDDCEINVLIFCQEIRSKFCQKYLPGVLHKKSSKTNVSQSQTNKRR